MLRGLLISKHYRPQFSGHETFPLRQLWLRKAFDAVHQAGGVASKSIFGDPAAIARFGVGKNMVAAIRHWALACDVIEETANGYAIGRVGEIFFGANGLDPYLEHPASAWLVHWYLAGEGQRSTTWYWLFNHVTGPMFDRLDVVRGLRNYCDDVKHSRSSMATIERDVDTCLRSYAPRSNNAAIEDFVEPVLGELGLISHLRSSEYTFRIGAKPSLPDGVVLFALARSWAQFATTANTLSLETIAYDTGAVGPVFKLDLDSLAERLARIEQTSNGAFAWSETAGLKQVIRRSEVDPFDFLGGAYGARPRQRH
ncbi:MAG: DUF4007 family protein [Alphaproteobacteria bacterium]|nr:DUF4007 family protein [Alphaproteobacteria bacterium]